MNPAVLCIATAMNFYSLPAGNTVVYELRPNPNNYQLRVQVLDTSMLRDWVFVGAPVGVGPTWALLPIGWMPYAGLTQCPIAAPPAPASAEPSLQR